MSPMILVYVLLIAAVVVGLIVAAAVYRARRGREPAGIPHAAPPLTEDRPPRPPR
jgi:hypothetical protein